MSDPTRFEAVKDAKRALHREELNNFSGELPWLSDPSQVGEDVLGEYAGSNDVAERCYGLARWMVGEYAEWSGKGQSRLSWGEVFEKYKIGIPDRVAIRETFQLNPGVAYIPGLLAMSEIFAVVPLVGKREGIGSSDWGEIADRARIFGGQIARDDTDVQYMVRSYLHVPQAESTKPINLQRLDPAKIRLDENTGVTTVTPINDLLQTSTGLLSQVIKLTRNACVALQAKSPCPHEKNVFDANWSAFKEIAGRIIYPQIVLPDNIAEQASPDPNYAQTLKAAALRLIREAVTYADLEANK